MANYNVSGLITLSELAKSKNKKWLVYILKCSDCSFYTGITNDINHRIKQHDLGLGAKYTKGRGPFVLLFIQEYENRSLASKRESEIKKLSRNEKKTLIHGK
jgi:putative endonuclease